MDTIHRIEVARFPQNKRFAVTTSWDDGRVEDRRLVEFMNSVGLKGTFNLNSALLKRAGTPSTKGALDASEVAELYRGHEVAIHTATHPHLTKLDSLQIISEVLDDRKAVEDLVGYPVRGMAYPFGSYSPLVIESLRSLGIRYARTVELAEPCFPPAEPLAWAATAHMFTENPLDIGQRFLKLLGNQKAGGVYFVWGHSFEFDRSDGGWSELSRRFKPLAGHSDVWYCTNIELFDYEDARKRMVIAANKRTALNPSAIPVTLLVDGAMVDVPAGRVIALGKA